MTDTTTPTPIPPDADLTAMEDLLDDLRTRSEEVPQWEFCEGFLAALVCCRRSIGADEFLDVLLDPEGFADAAQRDAFLALWQRRHEAVNAALAAEVQELSDEAAYHPDWVEVRGAVLALSEAERADMGDDAQDIPAFAQVWALGFMYAVENWPQEWVAPRDKEAARAVEAAMAAIVALTEDDPGPCELAPFSDDDAPTMSQARMDAFALAIWAVYDLFDVWRSLGPRVETVRKDSSVGRNDPCPCGSGQKYKKCHGA